MVTEASMDNHWFEWLLGGYVTLLTWLGKRAADHVDDHEIRIRTLETNRVTHADIDELRQSLTASIVNACERLEKQGRETREERQQMHIENQESIGRIHERVDALWERRSRQREGP